MILRTVTADRPSRTRQKSTPMSPQTVTTAVKVCWETPNGRACMTTTSLLSIAAPQECANSGSGLAERRVSDSDKSQIGHEESDSGIRYAWIMGECRTACEGAS